MDWQFLILCFKLHNNTISIAPSSGNPNPNYVDSTVIVRRIVRSFAVLADAMFFFFTVAFQHERSRIASSNKERKQRRQPPCPPKRLTTSSRRSTRVSRSTRISFSTVGGIFLLHSSSTRRISWDGARRVVLLHVFPRENSCAQLERSVMGCEFSVLMSFQADPCPCNMSFDSALPFMSRSLIPLYVINGILSLHVIPTQLRLRNQQGTLCI